LLRIANQDQVLGGLRNGDDIGEGHLPGLVDEQYVDGLEILGPGPKPEVPPTTWQHQIEEHAKEGRCLLRLQFGRCLLFIRPLHAAQGSKIGFVRSFDNFFKEFAYDFVALTGDADFLPCLSN